MNKPTSSRDYLKLPNSRNLLLMNVDHAGIAARNAPDLESELPNKLKSGRPISKCIMIHTHKLHFVQKKSIKL